MIATRSGGIVVSKLVGFDFTPSYADQKLGRAVAGPVASYEGALPDTYGMKAEDLADLMNAWHRRALDEAPAGYAYPSPPPG